MQLTDGGTFHERSQYFMKGWICGSIQNSDQQNIIKYTDMGRAWNRNSGEMGVTMNAAMLATIYGTYVAPSERAKSERYLCWARSQVRQSSKNQDSSLSVHLMDLMPVKACCVSEWENVPCLACIHPAYQQAGLTSKFKSIPCSLQIYSQVQTSRERPSPSDVLPCI